MKARAILVKFAHLRCCKMCYLLKYVLNMTLGYYLCKMYLSVKLMNLEPVLCFFKVWVESTSTSVELYVYIQQLF